MTTDKIIEEANNYLFNTYSRFPIVILKGCGMRVYDSHGKEYLDFLSGIAVNNLGHCYTRVIVDFQKQAQRLVHISNLFYNKPQIQLAKLIVEHSCGDKVFFCNSGAEANEAAIKLARKYMKDMVSKDRYEIITAYNSFHGRTMATISATGQEKFHKGFEPLLPGFKFVPFNNIDKVAEAINEKTAAVMIEPIQGEGGVNMPDENFLQNLRRLCDEKRILLILDEVQTGIGRTGKLFAYEHYGMYPDIFTLAKGLGGGMPIGAMVAKDEVAKAFTPGTHASTFGGNPLVCAAAIATLETIMEDSFILGNCIRLGNYFMDSLKRLQKRYPFIKDIRGKGLFIGMELEFNGREIVEECLEQGFIINCTMERILRFLPPLIVTREEIDLLIETLDRIFKRRR
ncbi:MAG: aspartate aminotransferase family protein [Nitrospirota bacterium]